ncbi:LamG domain-containing protein [Streptomyces sp. NPDC019890]|uniref:LamG domain-containing protein n=1 Tax=Streptomyces sp. NPDC019890 TaxID=3365064 RepID=UPI00384BFAF9
MGSADQRSDSALAAKSGEPVEVVEERTEYTTTMANPDGTFTLTQSTRPQRARSKDGAWRGIDVTLERRSDGTVGPKSTVVDLAFSGGGKAEPMISLGGKRGSMSLGWPESLPEPQLSGATATYPEVFKGVDLKLTATAEGYREVLVVKSAEAAANPELEQIKLTLKSDGLDIAAGAGGGLRAIDADGNAAFAGPAGVMWDSAGDAGAQTQLMNAAEEPEPEDPNRPGAGDATAELPVQLEGAAVAVEPDLGLLRGKETVYPVFIDPPMGLALQERTVLSSDGDRFWDFDGDHGVGNCSRLGPWYCGTDYTNRMYFEFAPTNLAGKYVVDAVFRAYETWSFSCAAHEVDLWRTNNISEGSTWPGPAHLDKMGDRNISAGRGTNCTPEQPDSWVEFHDNAAESDENLTSTVRSFADGKFSRLTLMLRAQNESDPDAWKRFDDNAELQINYVPKPGLPTPYGVIPGYGISRHCNPVNDPLTVTRPDPMVEAGVQALVQPASNGFKGSLRAYFYAERYDPVAKKYVHTWDATSPSTGYDPDGTLESVRMTNRAENITYRVKMLTQSYWTHEGTTSVMSSAYTPWCYFKTVFDAPKAPQVTSSDYTGCTSCEGEGAPGEPGKFTFKPNAAETATITGYRFWQVTQADGETLTPEKAVDYPITPNTAGEQRLFVQAKDVRERWGDIAAYVFKVKPAQGEVGRWRFNELPEMRSDFVSSDSATVGVRHDAALTGGATWSNRGRRGQLDYSLDLTSTDPAKQQAYASTSAPAINTRESFTVSVWAYLTDASSNRVLLSAPGDEDSAFTLYYSSGYKKWAFNRGAQDKTDTADVVSYSDAANPPVGVWTHLAGVFDKHKNEDKTDDTIQLFVNGRPQGSPVRLTGAAPAYEPWATTTGLQFGRTKATGTYQQYFRGHLDEVAVWQRALLAKDIRAESELKRDGVPTTELIADWNAELATGTEIQDRSHYARTGLKLSAEGAQLSTSQADGTTLLLDGEKGYASTTGPVVDETGSFTVSARVRVDSAKWEAKPIGYRGMVAGQKNAGESSWALWLDKTDFDEDGLASYMWRFERTSVDGTGKVTAKAEVPADDVLESSGFDVPVDVTAVFDAAQTDPADPNGTPGKLRLYIGAALQLSNPDAGLTSGAQGTGELAAGRGASAGTTGHYFPGSLDQLRIWSGAMTANGVNSAIVGTT